MRPASLIELLRERIGDVHPELDVLEVASEDLLGARTSSGAAYDRKRIYRYILWRTWDADLPTLVVIMLNPSTAGHEGDDRTIGTLLARCMHFGYGSLLVLNLFALRATEPSEMKSSEDPIGPANDSILDMLLELRPERILCAWGAHGSHQNRSEDMRCRISRSGTIPQAIRLTKAGEPEHPLYKSPSLPHEEWRIAG